MRSSWRVHAVNVVGLCVSFYALALGFLVPSPQSSLSVAAVRGQFGQALTHVLRPSPNMCASGPFSRRPLEHQLRRGHHQRRQANRRVRGDGGETLSSFRPTAAAARETNIDAEKAERGAADAAKAFAKELSVLDDEQAAMMAEECILVDRCDRPTGSGSKVETHLNSRGLLLHRAFSVFLFDRRGRLLMQRRADSKHTFAGYWTNTCCSHPLWNDFEMGTDLTTPKGDKMASEGDAAIAGATRAAVRKLGQELGIPAAQLPLEDFSFLTKVHYIASSGSTWGEHEIDYVFLIQADVDLDPNPNEVSEAVFLDREGLRALLASAERGEVELTPWSAYIIDHFVFGWWDRVGDKKALRSLRDDVIHRVGACEDGAPVEKEVVAERGDAGDARGAAPAPGIGGQRRGGTSVAGLGVQPL